MTRAGHGWLVDCEGWNAIVIKNLRSAAASVDTRIHGVPMKAMYGKNGGFEEVARRRRSLIDQGLNVEIRLELIVCLFELFRLFQ